MNLKYTIKNVTFEDGCYFGIITIFNDELRKYEIFSFEYDIEFDVVRMKQREKESFLANITDAPYSDFFIENYYDICQTIKSEVK